MRYLLFSVLVSCTSVSSTPEACLAPKLAPIDGARVAEAFARCKPTGWEKCPVREEIDAKYDALRAAAIRECE